MSLLLLVLGAAQGLPATNPPPIDAHRPQWARQQTFIAPSGEPFHAPLEAPFPVADWFARADANHDGQLTLAEFTADFMRFFAALDVNRDGVIDTDELQRYENVIAPEVHSRPWGGGGVGGGEGGGGGGGHRHGGGGHGGGWGGGHGGGWGGGGGGGGHHRGGEEGEGGEGEARQGGGHDAYGSRPEGAGRFDLLGMPEPVAAMDVNLNGRITQDEAIEAATMRFEALETLHRGYLTLAQLPKTYMQNRKPRKPRERS